MIDVPNVIMDICPSCMNLEEFFPCTGKKSNHQTYCKKCSSARAREYKRKIKIKVISHYGGCCSCCKNGIIEFLSIDHIDGNGRNHRKSINKVGGQFYAWLIKNGYPVGFRVLCHNCNMSLGIYGYCPHEKTNHVH